MSKPEGRKSARIRGVVKNTSTPPHTLVDR